MIGTFELFKIGIGPSSSHTVGPMKAAAAFAGAIVASGVLPRLDHVRVDLFGSLAWTGKGHGTDKAVILGLAGEMPDTIDPDAADAIVASVRNDGMLRFGGRHPIAFDSETGIVFDGKTVPPHHPNTLAFTAYDQADVVIGGERWCSVGGGFIVPESELGLPQ